MKMGSFAAEVEQLLQAARLHLARGEFHEAVGRATEVINRDAKQTSAYLIRAEAHRRLKQPERALADLAVAIRLDPNQPAPYLVRAEILKRRNQFDQAIADVTHALTIDPRNAAAFSIRAECRSAIGDQDGADRDVQEMLSIDPTRPVPNLQVKTTFGDPSPATDERSWKQSGRPGDLSVFADGKPVDKSYRSSQVVGDDDAPEALGVASGYKPGSISRPIPRVHSGRKRPSGAPLLVGLACMALLGIGYVLISPPSSPSAADTTKAVTEAIQPNASTATEPKSALSTTSEAGATSVPDTKPMNPQTQSRTTKPIPVASPSTPNRPVPVQAAIDPTDRDLKSLQGEWLCVAMEEIGNTLNKKAVREQDRRVTIKGHSYTMKRTENGHRHTLVGKFEIDASNGHFDFVGREQDGRSTVWVGIYELKGDTLKLCYRYRRNEDCVRPTSFETDTDKPNVSVSYVFKRDKE